jgi:hypothetical protein
MYCLPTPFDFVQNKGRAARPFTDYLTWYNSRVHVFTLINFSLER